ncbi:MAG: ParB N-terminal domain-containing protein [Bryobacterales bacterium]|nr:ParB N-terminal domain-containing protein [Bryobacterales bacterium]MDE0293089.1 ParB N-terminal domain-containing protein [Bryobacterales bacterium]
MNTKEIMPMRVSDLAFDIKNPRLAEFDLSVNSTEAEVIWVLWEAMDVRELVLSIAASGFFRHEPLIVAQESGKNVVIEGNRRLAAVKVLLEPTLAKNQKADVPAINQEARQALEEVPTVRGTRKDAWRYLGFKHVNGPAKWSSYAKSRYIADVHRNFGIKLEDIAKQIGDTHKTVQRLFRGLMVIEEAERLGVFRREDRWRRHFAFSHLYTGLDYPGISSFIGLRPEYIEGEEPVPLEKKGELRELCLWMYGSKREKTPPVIETQNPHLRQLDAVVSNKEAVAALRSGRDLAYAFETSRPSGTVFEESLLASKRELQKARGMLSTGYDGSEELLRIAGTVATLAEDLYREMDRKRNPSERKRLTEDG